MVHFPLNHLIYNSGENGVLLFWVRWKILISCKIRGATFTSIIKVPILYSLLKNVLCWIRTVGDPAKRYLDWCYRFPKRKWSVFCPKTRMGSFVVDVTCKNRTSQSSEQATFVSAVFQTYWGVLFCQKLLTLFRSVVVCVLMLEFHRLSHCLALSLSDF